jgi:hypothetical protein
MYYITRLLDDQLLKNKWKWFTTHHQTTQILSELWEVTHTCIVFKARAPNPGLVLHMSRCHMLEFQYIISSGWILHGGKN